MKSEEDIQALTTAVYACAEQAKAQGDETASRTFQRIGDALLWILEHPSIDSETKEYIDHMVTRAKKQLAELKQQVDTILQSNGTNVPQDETYKYN